jgi:hypothetical protein
MAKKHMKKCSPSLATKKIGEGDQELDKRLVQEGLI